MEFFSLTIQLGNDAMSAPADIAGALQDVRAKLNAGEISGTVRDANGNSVGEWEIA